MAATETGVWLVAPKPPSTAVIGTTPGTSVALPPNTLPAYLALLMTDQSIFGGLAEEINF